jgi:hypothetical protein
LKGFGKIPFIVNIENMTEVTRFYILAHIFISLVGAVLLLAIWYNISKRFKQLLKEDGLHKRIDKGLLYFSLAIFVWVLAGCWDYIKNSLTDPSAVVSSVMGSLFSIANDLFLLLALFYSDYAPAFIQKNPKNIKRAVVAVSLAAALTILLHILLDDKSNSWGIIFSAVPDIIVSGLLAALLIITFYRTFYNRGLKVVAVIAVIIIVLIFASIVPDMLPHLYQGFAKDLVKIVAKTSFIAISLVLATSWVIALANTPKPSEMAIKFMDWSLIKISIPSKGVYDATIEFGSKTTQYKNLLKFAIRRKLAPEAEQSILVGLGGEINNQSYLSRIIDNMNEILLLNDDQKLERKDLFTFIGLGQYRLRIIPENIAIDEALMKEFINIPENQAYKAICN